MKIIYAASNRIGANIQLSRFLENNNHEIKIAAYGKSSYDISHIDWNLNAVFVDGIIYRDSLTHKKYNQKSIENIFKDVIEYSPDLIISDNEYIFGFISNEINIPLWYCSPLNLIDGIVWDFERLIYSYYFFQYKTNKLPKADKYLIYSPFCDIKNPPIIKDKYNWVRPYYNEIDSNIIINEIQRKEIFNNILKYVKLNNDNIFTDGNTDNISDSIYSNKKILISPNIKNVESLVNSILVSKYNIGSNLGQVELLSMLNSIECIEKANGKTYNEIELNGQNHLQLHEWVEEYSYSIKA